MLLYLNAWLYLQIPPQICYVSNTWLQPFPHPSTWRSLEKRLLQQNRGLHLGPIDVLGGSLPSILVGQDFIPALQTTEAFRSRAHRFSTYRWPNLVGLLEINRYDIMQVLKLMGCSAPAPWLTGIESLPGLSYITFWFSSTQAPMQNAGGAWRLVLPLTSVPFSVSRKMCVYVQWIETP